MKNAKNKLLNWLIQTLTAEVKQHNKTKLITASGLSTCTRRKFIANTTKGAISLGLAASLPALITSCGDGTTTSSNNSKSPTTNNNSIKKEDILDVAILGGGIAGLNCANHLLGSKLNFKLFEASKRFGGRILTHKNDSLGLGIFPEFGGDFIDSNHEDMLNLAKEFNLELIDLEKEQKEKKLIKDIYFFENKKIPEDKIIVEFKKIAKKNSRRH